MAVWVALTTSGEPKSETLAYGQETPPPEGAIIRVDGRWAKVWQVWPTSADGHLLDCRRVYRYELLLDEGGAIVGDYFHDPTFSQLVMGTPFMPDEDEGRVFRPLRMEESDDDAFDGVLIVEPFAD